MELSEKQKQILQDRHKKSLVRARKEAVKQHNKLRLERIQAAKTEALDVVKAVATDSKTRELALAMLYWGEGQKRDATSIANTDPQLLRFVLAVMRSNYSLTNNDFHCRIHGRADQAPDELISYWSKELKLPRRMFRGVLLDKRTRGKATFEAYKGICVLYFGNIAIQRKLKSIYNLYSRRVVEDLGL